MPGGVFIAIMAASETEASPKPDKVAQNTHWYAACLRKRVQTNLNL
jgi:hypothetical protein